MLESVKLRAYVLKCQRVLCAYVLTCKCVLRDYVLTYHRVLHSYVLTCHVPSVFTSSLATCLALMCSRANLPCVLTGSRASVLVLMPLFSVSLLLLLKLYRLLERFKSLITVFSQ